MSRKKKKDSEKKKLQGKRVDRRFVAQSSTNAWLVRALGGLGATALGAGVWGYFYGHTFEGDEALQPVPSYLIAGGAILTGVAIWLGTSSDAPIRVGAPGVGVERGEVRRIPWHGVTEITWESGALTLAVTGKDEAGATFTLKVPVSAHPEAVGWIVKEALDRIPKRVDIPDEILEKLPAASEHNGLKIELEPLQVVGKKCAATGQTITYELDARVCTRCERVYFKRAVPKRCKCSNPLAHLRSPTQGDDEDDVSDDEPDADDATATEAEAEASEEAREEAKS